MQNNVKNNVEGWGHCSAVRIFEISNWIK